MLVMGGRTHGHSLGGAQENEVFFMNKRHGSRNFINVEERKQANKVLSHTHVTLSQKFGSKAKGNIVDGDRWRSSPLG